MDRVPEGVGALYGAVGGAVAHHGNSNFGDRAVGLYVLACREGTLNDVLYTILFIQGGYDNKELHAAMGLDLTILARGPGLTTGNGCRQPGYFWARTQY